MGLLLARPYGHRGRRPAAVLVQQPPHLAPASPWLVPWSVCSEITGGDHTLNGRCREPTMPPSTDPAQVDHPKLRKLVLRAARLAKLEEAMEALEDLADDPDGNADRKPLSGLWQRCGGDTDTSPG